MTLISNRLESLLLGGLPVHPCTTPITRGLRCTHAGCSFGSSSSLRPPSSSISYTGQLNDDVRSPGSGSTPGPLSAQPPTGMDPADAEPHERSGGLQTSKCFTPNTKTTNNNKTLLSH
uniref:Uncharacterized protein n=1 Tax=Anopheles merus TaxID=30066 RepID=A0A182VK66_ANOME